jgi:carbonic anhydrase
VAGNFASDEMIASLEYAVAVLVTSLILGHAARTNGSVKQNIAPRRRFSAQMVPP